MLTEQQQALLDWEKTDGLLPVVVQHAVSGEVLMLGYMNDYIKRMEHIGLSFVQKTELVIFRKMKRLHSELIIHLHSFRLVES